MKRWDKNRAAVLAAGGIVVADGPQPLIAIVRLRKNKSWVLPKGKLKPGEDAAAAARREVLEETGHDVLMHEFLGSMSHASGRRLKIVQFWRMQVAGAPVRELMRDVKAVRWLPLQQAIEALTDAHEQVFLAQVGPAAIVAAERSAREPSAPPATQLVGADPGAPATGHTFVATIRAWFRRLL
jgi:8-oxo-dGTP diphosphatase